MDFSGIVAMEYGAICCSLSLLNLYHVAFLFISNLQKEIQIFLNIKMGSNHVIRSHMCIILFLKYF
jgi:hypothetical protein